MRLRYRDEGRAGARSAVVLVHGWALDLEMWQPQVMPLGARHRVLRIDRRSFGTSGGSANLDDDAADILHLLERLGIDRAAVVGMSQGARVAVILANAAPARIRALVLDGSPALEGMPEDGREEELPIALYQRTLREHGVQALRRELASHPFMQLRTQDPAVRRLLRGVIDRYRALDLRIQGTGIGPSSAVPVPSRQPHAQPDLHSLRLPVLVLNGAHDTAHRREVGGLLAKLLPNASREQIDGAGHLPNLDAPAAYNRAVLEFLERHAPTTD